MEFSLSKIRQVQVAALCGGLIPLLEFSFIFVCLSLFMQTALHEGLFVGAFMTMSSTAIIVKHLSNVNATETVEGELLVGVLVTQDVVLGVVLAVMQSLTHGDIWTAAVMALRPLGGMLVFCAGMWVLAISVVPVFFRLISWSREITHIGIVAFLLTVAGTAEHFGLSMEMGSFVAGLMCTQMQDCIRREALEVTEVLRDVFGGLFFCSIGLVIDPVFLWDNSINILYVFVAIVVGKTVCLTPLFHLAGYQWNTSFKVAFCLAHVGEFAFVLAGKGAAVGIISRKVYLLLLGTTALSLFATPLLLKLVSRMTSLPGNSPQLKENAMSTGMTRCSLDDDSDDEKENGRGSTDNLVGKSEDLQHFEIDDSTPTTRMRKQF
eukprot:GHVQ01037527.1.p1 GENE.GHVQ01037527.1~~GHVQ01037527.1.p1  ORF type:complete len:420 (+),score=42.98 GHVQ01037527.1:128-1261(+)